jgi:hypothetical protein
MCRRILVLIGLFFVLAFPYRVAAQLLEPVRLELPARIDVPAYHIEVLGEKGLLVYYESTELDEEGKRRWYFSLLDTNLREVWLQYVALTDGLAYHSAHSQDGKTVFLFVSPDGKRSPSIYEILQLHHSSAAFRLMGGTLPEKAEIKGMAALGHQLMMAVNLPKYTTDLLLFDMEQNQLQSIGHGQQGQSVVQYINASLQCNCFVVALKLFDGNRFKNDVFMTFDPNGGISRQWSFANEEHYLHAMTAIMDDDNKMIVAGSYDLQKRRASLKDAANAPELTNEAKGLFLLRFGDNEQTDFSFHPFESFTNIYRALSTEDLIRTRQRSLRNRSTESDLNIGFQFFDPRLIPFQDMYVYSAEAFKPKYRLETRMDYDFYGRLVPFTYSIFEGYQFFTAVVAAFSRDGKLIWSSDMELRDVLVPRLKKNANVIPDSTCILITMLQNGLLHSKLVAADGVQMGQLEQNRIESTFTNDKLLEERNSLLLHWYGKYYVATGYQRISNNRLPANNPRTAFYLQKLILE